MKQDDRVVVSRAAVEWLKTHYPQLCIKAGLCESVGGRLYTRTFSAAPEAPALPAVVREALNVARQALKNVQGDYLSPNGMRRDIDAAIARIDALVATKEQS